MVERPRNVTRKQFVKLSDQLGQEISLANIQVSAETFNKHILNSSVIIFLPL